AFFSRRRVSRFGVIPKPTVKVRMKENGSRRRRSCAADVPYALILVFNEESHESDVVRLPFYKHHNHRYGQAAGSAGSDRTGALQQAATHRFRSIVMAS